MAFADTNAYKQNTLRMLANLRIVILEEPNLNDEDQEDVMELSTAYLEWEQKTLQQGEQRGELKGEQKLLIKLLNQRFGEIEQPIIQKIRELPGEQLEELTDILLTLGNVIDKGKMAKQ